jgi:hypothetical protein
MKNWLCFEFFIVKMKENFDIVDVESGMNSDGAFWNPAIEIVEEPMLQVTSKMN